MKNEKFLNNSELPAFLPCLILLLCCFFGLWTKKAAVCDAFWLS